MSVRAVTIFFSSQFVLPPTRAGERGPPTLVHNTLMLTGGIPSAEMGSAHRPSLPSTIQPHFLPDTMRTTGTLLEVRLWPQYPGGCLRGLISMFRSARRESFSTNGGMANGRRLNEYAAGIQDSRRATTQS